MWCFDSRRLSQRSAHAEQYAQTKTNPNPSPDPNARIQKFIHYMAIAGICDSGLSSVSHVCACIEAEHSVECITPAGKSVAFLHFVTTWPSTFWPAVILICERWWTWIDDFSYSCFSCLDRQTKSRTDTTNCFKPGFQYPSSRPELTGDKKCTWVDRPSTRMHFLTPINSARELGPSTRVVETGLYSCDCRRE